MKPCFNYPHWYGKSPNMYIVPHILLSTAAKVFISKANPWRNVRKGFELRWQSDELGGAERGGKKWKTAKGGLKGLTRVNLPMFTSSSVSASPIHSNWNSCRDRENLWTAAERSATEEDPSVRAKRCCMNSWNAEDRGIIFYTQEASEINGTASHRKENQSFRRVTYR